jgi:hypothetical protein
VSASSKIEAPTTIVFKFGSTFNRSNTAMVVTGSVALISDPKEYDSVNDLEEETCQIYIQ